MIVDDRITTYLHSLEMPDIPVIEEIEKEALEAYVPIGCLNEPLYAKGRTYYHD